MVGCEKYLIYHTDDNMWDNIISQLSIEKQDIYFSAFYHHLYEDKDALAELFYFKENEKIAVYPYIKHSIVNTHFQNVIYDIESVYGYSGPVANTDDIEFLSRFDEIFCSFCKDNNIVAEFIRYNPLIKNENVFSSCVPIHNRLTIEIDLSPEIDDIWMNQISTRNRNVIRRCYKNGLLVELSDDYDSFRSIYYETMNKVNAESFYYFNDSYFNSISESDDYKLFVVKKDDVIIAAAIFMGYGYNFHYHLAGSRKEYLNLFPNNILIWEAIKFAKNKGFKRLHLGGGLTDSEEDNLFRFKAKFSNNRLDFFIGKRVHDNDKYDFLINEWETNNKTKAKMFLQYRL